MSWTAARHHKGLDAFLAGARHGSTSKRCVRWSSPALFGGRARGASASRCRDPVSWTAARHHKGLDAFLAGARHGSTSKGCVRWSSRPCSVVEPGERQRVGVETGWAEGGLLGDGLDALLAGARHGSTSKGCVRWSSGPVRWSSPASVSEPVSRPGEFDSSPSPQGSRRVPRWRSSRLDQRRCVRWSSPALFGGRARRASASRCRDRVTCLWPRPWAGCGAVASGLAGRSGRGCGRGGAVVVAAEVQPVG